MTDLTSLQFRNKIVLMEQKNIHNQKKNFMNLKRGKLIEMIKSEKEFYLDLKSKLKAMIYNPEFDIDKNQKNLQNRCQINDYERKLLVLRLDDQEKLKEISSKEYQELKEKRKLKISEFNSIKSENIKPPKNPVIYYSEKIEQNSKKIAYFEQILSRCQMKVKSKKEMKNQLLILQNQDLIVQISKMAI